MPAPRRPFSWRRRLPRASVASFALAGLCAAAAFLLVQRQSARLEALMPGRATPVVVAGRALEAGHLVAPEDLVVVARREPPPGAIGATAGAVGKVLVAPIAPGEPLTATRLSGSALAGLVAPGRLVIELSAVGAPEGLAAGDRVDVFATFAGARPYTSVVGADVRVVRVRGGTAGIDGETEVLVALDVDETTARAVLGAAAVATLGVAVHGPAPSPSPLPGSGDGAS